MKRTLSITISFTTAAIALLAGLLVMAGYFTHTDMLSFGNATGTVKMKFNSALCLVLSATALLLYSQERKDRRSMISSALSILVIIISALTLIQFIFGVNIGIDELFIKDSIRTSVSYYAGRMSPLASINFILIGTGLLLLHRKETALYQYIYLALVSFISVVMLIGSNFSEDIPAFLQLPLQLCTGFLCIAIAIYYTQPAIREKTGFEQKLLSFFIAAILIIGIISTLTAYYTKKLLTTSGWVEHTKNVLTETEKVLSLSKDIQSGGRGYIITGDSSYLQNYLLAKKEVYDHLDKLKDLTVDNDVQQQRVNSLQDLVDRRIAFTAKMISARYKEGFQAAYMLIITREGSNVSEKIRQLVLNMQEIESRLLSKRQEDNERTNADFRSAFYILLISMVALLVLVFLTIRHNLEARKKTEEKFRSLLEAAPDAIVIANEKGDILIVNRQTEVLFGYRRDELTGKSVEKLIPVGFSPKSHNNYAVNDKTGAIGAGLQLSAIRKNGTQFPVEISLSPLSMEEGMLFTASIRDITERKKIEDQVAKQKQEISDFIDSMSTLTAKVATDGTILMVNKIAMQASGLPLKELLRTNFLEGHWWIYDPEVKERVSLAFQKACTGIPVSYEEQIFVFGQILTIKLSLIPILDDSGKVDYIVAEGSDISEQKKAEADILHLNKELESFTYSVSHDLRAPLRIIDGYAEILAADHSEKIGEDGNRVINIIKSNARRMGQLIDDLLNLSHIGRKELVIHMTDMNKVVDHVIEDLQVQVQHTATIHVEKLSPAKCDANLVRQVWINLVSNAVKYSAKQEAPAIEISSQKRAGEIIYSVKDNGVGFDMKYADKLFGVFQRLHKISEFEGTGVGLALVKRIVAKHSGTVWVEAEPGKGATFFFSLPA